MDENQIGPNMDTTLVQSYVRDGRYPSGKAVPCTWKVLGSNPNGVNLQDYRQDEGHHGNFFSWFFFGFFLFLLCPLCWGSPRMQDLCPLVGPQKVGFRHPILILSPW